MTRRFLVTSALPYANNRPHLGHIAGAYLPADVYVRYLRMLGDDVLFICGSDDHGVAVVIAAQKEGFSPQELVARNRAYQEKAFAGLRIEFDIYSGTSTCPSHVGFSQEFFTSIHSQGLIAPRETEQFYCRRCERFLPDRYVEGECPRCHAEGARGDQCDSCGETYEQTELLNPYCAICNDPPDVRSTRHWFLKLSAFEDRLREYLESRQGWRDSVRNYALGIVKQGLPERSITRDLTWGVDVPLEGADGKCLYVWFDAPIGYLSFTEELFQQRGDPEGWRRYWQDDECRLVHFIGKDNTFFHAVIWPAILMGQAGFVLPHNIPANEFLTFKGAKISKSRGSVLWADEFLEQYPADRIRYYLTANAPEGRDTSFTEEEFLRRNNDELSDVLGNLCHRVFTFVDRYFEGKIPAGVASHDGAPAVLSAITTARDRWRECLEACRFRDALAATIDLARTGNRAFDAAEPWKTRKEDLDRCGRDLGTFLEIVHALGVVLTPFLPDSAERLRGAFAGEAVGAEAIDALGEVCLVAGTPLESPGILFPRLE